MSSTSDDDDDNSAIVLDNGSGKIKAGFAGDDAPRVVIPTVVGRPLNDGIGGKTSDIADVYVGDAAQHRRDVMSLACPITRGVVTNWEDMEAIWQYVFDNELRTDPSSRSILVSEPPLNPKSNRAKIAEVLFETFNVPALYVEMDSVLEMYAHGDISAIVVSSGDSVSTAMPIYEGYMLEDSVRRIDLGGKDITDHVLKYVHGHGYQTLTKTPLDANIARTIKEQCCYVAVDYAAEPTRISIGKQLAYRQTYTLPDGVSISLNQEIYEASEGMFKPEMIGHDHVGLHQMVFDSIMSTDPDLRGKFFNQIFLSGGNTMFTGTRERFQSEMESLVKTVDHVLPMPVKVYALPERKCTVWIGGSILASLTCYKGMFTTKEQHEEHGPDIATLFHHYVPPPS